ncbi:MAG: hypothetical protein D6741_09120 [Planctomycetota bacterium]|nr:MAG: hypothetical protein D6741_09120 [Planctomycetota bacterium]
MRLRLKIGCVFSAVVAAALYGGGAWAEDSLPVIVLDSPAPSSVDVPVSVDVVMPIDATRCRETTCAATFGLIEIDAQGKPISDRILPAQFVPKEETGGGDDRSEGIPGTLWWLLPASDKRSDGATQRRFRVVEQETATPVVRIEASDDGGTYRFVQSVGEDRATPLLQYNWKQVPVPEGTPPHFAAGQSYLRGDYIHPLFGPNGRVLTDDYPADHPHHRGIWWTWPVVRWNDRVGDIWAVVDVWAFPVAVERVVSGPVFAELTVTNVWKFGAEKTPIVRETVRIRAFRRSPQGEGLLEVEVRLLALCDNVSIAGRPKASYGGQGGYSGFALRAAPADGQKITPFVDPPEKELRCSWLDYVANFDGKGPAGMTLVEHPSNPGYPNPWYEYPNLNCVMPSWPEEREVAVPRDKPIVLRYRMWVHSGETVPAKCGDVWRSFASPPNGRSESAR